MNVLNPRLYWALKRAFGRVRVSNPGVPMTATYTPGPDGRPRLTPHVNGEYYVVVCPFCHDTKGHLYVNHRWGVRDRENGTRNLWLANCFLDDCMTKWENREALAERLEDYSLSAAAGELVLAEAVEAPPFELWELPRNFTLLSDLGPKHLACRYVCDRGFSPPELSREWGIGYACADYGADRGRLIIPLRACLRDFNDPGELDGDEDAWQLVGYQSRAVWESQHPKYLTTQGTRKSRLLYGLDRLPHGGKGPVIVCEGPTDVWRAGPGAVAVLGKHISDAQCKLLRAHAPGADIVVMLDPDAADAAGPAAERIRTTLARDLVADVPPGRVAVAKLPDDRDPGDCSRREIWACAKKALKSRPHAG
jgi:hypothetical protein